MPPTIRPPGDGSDDSDDHDGRDAGDLDDDVLVVRHEGLIGPQHGASTRTATGTPTPELTTAPLPVPTTPTFPAAGLLLFYSLYT
jgi:hypothetical protein